MFKFEKEFLCFLAAICACIVIFTSKNSLYCDCLESWSEGLSSPITYNGSEYVIFIPTAYDGTIPLPLVITLHGDEGIIDTVLWFWEPVWRSRQDAVYVAPRAPYAGGSWWQAPSEHEVWIDGLVDKILSEYLINLNKVYITGWSGGACFMGYYTVGKQDRYASGGYCIGGCWGGYASPPSPECRIPSRFVTGSNDFMHDQTQHLANELESRGHEVEFIDIPGLGHDVHEQCLAPQLDWMMSHTLCGLTEPVGSCASVDGVEEQMEVAEAIEAEDEPVAEYLPETELEFESDTTVTDEYEYEGEIEYDSYVDNPDDPSGMDLTIQGGCGCTIAGTGI